MRHVRALTGIVFGRKHLPEGGKCCLRASLGSRTALRGVLRRGLHGLRFLSVCCHVKRTSLKCAFSPLASACGSRKQNGPANLEVLFETRRSVCRFCEFIVDDGSYFACGSSNRLESNFDHLTSGGDCLRDFPQNRQKMRRKRHQTSPHRGTLSLRHSYQSLLANLQSQTRNSYQSQAPAKRSAVAEESSAPQPGLFTRTFFECCEERSIGWGISIAETFA